MKKDKDYTYKFCIIGQESARQKLMTVRFLRTMKVPALAIDSFNAQKKEVIKDVEFALVFRPSKRNDPIKTVGDLVDNGWPEYRILVEGDDFPVNTFPSENID